MFFYDLYESVILGRIVLIFVESGVGGSVDVKIVIYEYCCFYVVIVFVNIFYVL